MRTSWVAAAVLLGALTLPLNGQRIAPKLDNVSVPPGYFLDLLVTGLDFPTAITFSPGAAYVAESGAVPGFTPKVKTVNAQGQVSIVLSADQLGASQLLPPLTDITYHRGWLYITHRQVGANGWTVGAVSRPAERGVVHAARAYAETLRGVGAFDLVLLGLGDDGHTASLFPGRDPGLGENAPDALAVLDAPKPPPHRVSLSARRLSRARAVLFLVAGEAKRSAIEQWHAGADIPARAIQPRAGVDVLVEAMLLRADHA